MSKLFTKKFRLILGIIFSFASFVIQANGEESDALLAKLSNPDHRVEDVAFSPDGKLLAAGYGFYNGGGIAIWTITDRPSDAKLIVRLPFEDGIKCVAFSKDGKLFAAASFDGDVMLWNVGVWNSHKTVMTKRGDTEDMSFSPDSTKLAYASEKTAVLYDIQSEKAAVLTSERGDFPSFYGISFSSDGKSLVLCKSKSIQIWDVNSKKMTGVLQSGSFGFFGRVSPDGKHIISGGGAIYGDKLVEIWDFPAGKKINELTKFRNGIFALAIANSGKLFAVSGGTYGGGEGALSLWNLEEGREIGFVSFGDYPIQGLAFNPDDSILAAASTDGYVLLYAVDRIRGAHIKKQDSALCGEIMVEGNKAYVVPISRVPRPMREHFEYSWQLEIANADSVMRIAGSPVVVQDWAIESSAATDRARIKKFKSLLLQDSSASKNSDYIVFGDVQNPGWNDGFLIKIYSEGSFVATNNSGKCLANGNLNQLGTDIESVKKRLISAGLIDIPKNPVTLGTDHYRTRFIEMTINSASELRSDADNIAVLLNGGKAKKREAFSRIFNKEEVFINSLLRAGMKLMPN